MERRLTDDEARSHGAGRTHALSAHGRARAHTGAGARVLTSRQLRGHRATVCMCLPTSLARGRERSSSEEARARARTHSCSICAYLAWIHIHFPASRAVSQPPVQRSRGAWPDFLGLPPLCLTSILRIGLWTAYIELNSIEFVTVFLGDAATRAALSAQAHGGRRQRLLPGRARRGWRTNVRSRRIFVRAAFCSRRVRLPSFLTLAGAQVGSIDAQGAAACPRTKPNVHAPRVAPRALTKTRARREAPGR